MELVRVVVGSRMWGVDIPGSDVDTRSIYVPPLIRAVSPYEDREIRHHADDSDDHVTYPLSRFVSLAAKGNPTILEVLYSRMSNYDRWLEPWEPLHPIDFIDLQAVRSSCLGMGNSTIKRKSRIETSSIEGKRKMGKLISSTILSMKAGIMLIHELGVYYPHILDEDDRQLHRELRAGYRLEEGEAEFEETIKLLEESKPTPLIKPQVEKVEEWVLFQHWKATTYEKIAMEGSPDNG